MSVKDVDHGWAKIMEAVSMDAGSNTTVAVGVQGTEADEIRDELGVITGAVLAGVHEFGREDGSIPERSFIRATVDARRDEILKLQARLLGLVLQGKLTHERALALLGEKIKSWIQQAFEDGLKPDLEQSTKDARIQGKKGKDGKSVFKPLIDTGALKNSITYEVRK